VTEALRAAIGLQLEAADQAFHERYVGELRTALGEAALEAARAEGRAMALENAVYAALASCDE
jgi:hypothetical protein